MASVILPAGGSFREWAPRPETAVQDAVKGKSDHDLQFEAIKNLPGIKRQAQAFDLESIEDGVGDQPCPPCPPTDGAAADEDKPAEGIPGVKEDLAEEKPAEEDVAGKATEVAEKASELADAAKDLAEQAGGEAGEAGEEGEKDEGEKEEGDGDDLAVVDVTLEKEAPVEPAGVLDADPSGVDKVGKEGCLAADKGKKTVAKKVEPKVAEKKVEPKAAEKKAAAETMPKTGVPSTGKFMPIAALTPENRREVREYWVALGFPTEYVDAMVKDYEE